MRVYKFITGLFILTLFSFAIFSLSYAQDPSSETPEEKAAKHGITFPIAELGNCQDYSSCRAFCEDPVNQSVCIDFAKNKGFYKEDPVETNKEEILANAKTELGCDSYDSCMSFCQNSSNFDKCDAFAKKHNLGGGHVSNTEEQEFLAKAKEVLGCDSPSSCMNFCGSPQNRDKCSEFAKQMGVRGGHHEQGPGGCTTDETCSAFCSVPSNYEICSSHSKASGESFSGPGGCNNEESCREYCSKNPKECGFEGTDSNYSHPVYNPQEMCSKTPDCSWNNDRCECIQKGTEYEGDVQTQTAPTGYSNMQYISPSRIQESDSQDYQSPTRDEYDPAEQCAKTAGCSWTGSTCQCSSQTSGGTQQTTQETQTQTQSSGDSQNYTPPSDSVSSESYTPPPSGEVHGTTASRGLFFVLLDFLKTLFSR